MGSLSLAAFGAVAGAGQGIAEVGQQAQKEQLLEKQSDLAAARDATHERLRAKLDADNRQAEQERAQTFQHTETETQAGRAGKIAQAKLDAAKAAQGVAVQAKHEDVGTLAAARRYAADRSVDRASAGAEAKGPKPMFTKGGYLTIPSTQIGGQPQKLDIVNYGAVKLIKVPGTTNYAPYDGVHIPDPKNFSRSAAPGIIQDAAANPERIGSFFNRFGYVDQSHVLAGSVPLQGRPTGVPKSAPAGTTYTPAPEDTAPAKGSAAGGSESNAEDAAEDRDVVNSDYGQYGDIGHQPEDDMPAQ